MATSGVSRVAQSMLMPSVWTTVRDHAARRLGRQVSIGYAVLLLVGVVAVLVSLVLMRF